jgi:hypothetical protein
MPPLVQRPISPSSPVFTSFLAVPCDKEVGESPSKVHRLDKVDDLAVGSTGEVRKSTSDWLLVA